MKTTGCDTIQDEICNREGCAGGPRDGDQAQTK